MSARRSSPSTAPITASTARPGFPASPTWRARRRPTVTGASSWPATPPTYTRPWAGRGSNIGVQDAVNLGWKLAQVVKGASPDSLLDTYHAERHPVAARVLRNTMAQVALRRTDERSKALGDTVADLLGTNDARKHLAAEMSGLGVHYNLGEGHPLLGRRIPDLELVTAKGPLRLFTLLHKARPVLLNLG